MHNHDYVIFSCVCIYTDSYVFKDLEKEPVEHAYNNRSDASVLRGEG